MPEIAGEIAMIPGNISWDRYMINASTDVRIPIIFSRSRYEGEVGRRISSLLESVMPACFEEISFFSRELALGLGPLKKFRSSKYRVLFASSH